MMIPLLACVASSQQSQELWLPDWVYTGLWLDPSDNANLDIVSGNDVNAILDKSGNGHNFSYVSNRSNLSTINGVQAVHCDGNGWYYRSSSNWSDAWDPSVGFSGLMVVQTVSTVNGKGYMACWSNPYRWNLARKDTGELHFSLRTSSATTERCFGDPHPPLGVQLFGFECRPGGDFRLWNLGECLDSQPMPASLATGDSHITLGSYLLTAGAQVNAIFGEVILFPEYYCHDLRRRFEGHLAHKWGIASSLIDGHPYKASAPIVNELWTPAEANTLLWVDATDDDFITYVGGEIDTLEDKSGNGYDFSYSNSRQSPGTINGVQAAYLDGSNWFTASYNVNLTPSKGFGALMLIQTDTTTNNRGYMGIWSDGALIWGLSRGSDGKLQWFVRNSSGSSTVCELDPHPAAGVLLIGFDVAVNGKMHLWLNGVLQDEQDTPSTFASGSAAVALGSYSAVDGTEFTGKIGEVLFFKTFDNLVRQRAEGYLVHKFNAAGILSSDHPYKSNVPLIEVKPTDPHWNDVTLLVTSESGTVADRSNSPITLNADTAGAPVGEVDIYNEETMVYEADRKGLYISSGDVPVIAGGTDGTIELTFKVTDVSTIRYLLGQWDANPFPIIISVNEDLELRTDIYNLSWVYDSDPTAVITLHKVHHYALSRTGSTLKAFLDGKEVASATYTGNLFNTSEPLYIGNAGASSGYDANTHRGSILQLRVTNGVGRYTNNFAVIPELLPQQGV